MKGCWECEIVGVPLHNHHPVPKVRGGTKTIPLCEACHSKAHHRKKNMNTSALVKEGLRRAKARGVKLGGRNLPMARVMGQRALKVNADNFARKMKPIIEGLMAEKITSYYGLAKELNNRKITTRRGKSFQATTVKRLLNRFKAF
jgi:hypothetical protein